jgi:uncharacterized membrane protein (DUF2068 family)
MSQLKWFDQSQPQTLQGAVIFSYLNAALAVLFFIIFGAGITLMLILLGGAAYGIANEKRWAYWAAVVLACLYLLGQIIVFLTGGGFAGILALLFAGLLVALLLHPDSRSYQRVWFK